MMNFERLTARNKNGLAYLVNVKPNEQEVDSPHKNTLKCILECFERLAQYEEEAIARQSVKNKEVNLCNDCEYGCMAACPITENVKFGNGQGNDNVIECENYINKEALKKWRINKTLEQED